MRLQARGDHVEYSPHPHPIDSDTRHRFKVVSFGLEGLSSIVVVQRLSEVRAG